MVAVDVPNASERVPNRSARHARVKVTKFDACGSLARMDGLSDSARALLNRLPQPKGLLLWLLGRDMPFPMNLAAPQFDAIRQALRNKDAVAFEQAAFAVVGLGPGLTPSGDDFLGGIFYADKFIGGKLQCNCAPILAHCQTHSHPTSAAIMARLIAGESAGPLQNLLSALSTHNKAHIDQATQALLLVGAQSGADMLAGVITYLEATR